MRKNKQNIVIMAVSALLLVLTACAQNPAPPTETAEKPGPESENSYKKAEISVKMCDSRTIGDCSLKPIVLNGKRMDDVREISTIMFNDSLTEDQLREYAEMYCKSDEGLYFVECGTRLINPVPAE